MENCLNREHKNPCKEDKTCEHCSTSTCAPNFAYHFCKGYKDDLGKAAFAEIFEVMEKHRKIYRSAHGIENGKTAKVLNETKQSGFGMLVWKSENGKTHSEVFFADEPIRSVETVIKVLEQMNREIGKDPAVLAEFISKVVNKNCGDPNCPVHSHINKDIPVA